jgi:hypothetical protein
METRNATEPGPGVPAAAPSGRRLVLLAGVPFNPVTALLLEPALFRVGFAVLLACAAYLFLGPALTATRQVLSGSTIIPDRT